MPIASGFRDVRDVTCDRPSARGVRALRLLYAVVTGAALSLFCPAAADAQIYAWRDASGHLVLSDKAKDPSAQTYSISPAANVAFRTTRPLNKRAAQFHSIIEEHAALNDVSPDLVRALIQAESAFNPRAVSPKGAMGLMQLMPGTAAVYRVLDPFNPVDNIRAGVKYLKLLLNTYQGRVELALAAYNAGPGAVKKYGGKVPPYRETQNYVARIQGTNAATTGTSGALAAAGEKTRVYKTIELVEGRAVIRYTGAPRAGSERLSVAERR